MVDVVEHQSMLLHFVFSIDSPICTISVFRVKLYVQFTSQVTNFLFWHDYSAESIGNKMASKEKHVNTEYFSITKELHEKGASLDEKLLN